MNHPQVVFKDVLVFFSGTQKEAFSRMYWSLVSMYLQFMGLQV